MNIEVKHMGDVQFSIATRGHMIYSDQPEDNGGYDEGMTPPEMFLGALGACAAYYAVAHLKRNGLPYEGTTVNVHAEKLKNPARLGEIVFQVATSSSLNPEQCAALEQSVAKCILHNTLTHPPSLRTEILSGSLPMAAAA
jgi:uncharacterized OsmC-like protein